MQCKAIQRTTGIAGTRILSMAGHKHVGMCDSRKPSKNVTRKKSRSSRSFTETLSPEAREALESAKADKVASKERSESKGQNGDTGTGCKPTVTNGNQLYHCVQDTVTDNADNVKTRNSAEGCASPIGSCKIADIYEQFSPEEAVTLENSDILNQHIVRTARGHIRAIGGGKVNCAMETVEIVMADETPDYITQPTDEEVSEEMQRVSVEKCLVWMEANERIQGQSASTSDVSQ